MGAKLCEGGLTIKELDKHYGRQWIGVDTRDMIPGHKFYSVTGKNHARLPNNNQSNRGLQLNLYLSSHDIGHHFDNPFHPAPAMRTIVGDLSNHDNIFAQYDTDRGDS